MPHGGGRKRTTPRKAYAQKAAKANNGPRPFAKFPSRPNDESKNPFSMTDAARNTGHRGDWGDKKLRHSHISFVNAGHVSNAEEEARETTWSDADELDQTNPVATQPHEPAQTAPDSNLQPHAATHSLEHDQQNNNSQPTSTLLRTEAEKPRFFIDTEGDASLQPTKPAGTGSKAMPREEDVDSDSSEEEIVFRGKNTGTTGRRGSPRKNAVTILDEDMAATKLSDETLTGTGISLQSIPEPEVNLPPALPDDTTAEDAAVNDYVENLRAQGLSEKELHDMGFLVDPSEILEALEHEMESEEESFDDIDSDGDDSGNDEAGLENELSNLDIDSEDEPPDEAQLGQAALAMTDEEIARRLAKQEELGMPSNEILLWADGDMDGIVAEEEDELALDYLRDAASRMTGKSKRAQRRNKSLLPDMIDELEGGDDYGDFDVMDFDRPSLQRNKKSKGLPFAVSDSELEANMIATWENDRSKKAKRKQEREQLRAEGLLNGGSESAQFRAKYAGGISMMQIRDEIKVFLASGGKSLSLVAMDKQSRKAVHEIANRLNLRSKSKGDGMNRYPCLYRTSGTLEFDEVMVDAVIRRYGAGKGGRFKFKGPSKMKLEKGARSRGGFGGVRDGASYRDGETVGASAPALGAENRGHAMLAKMGWTMGTGLGALNNKGKLEPVPHVVKATRAGLG